MTDYRARYGPHNPAETYIVHDIPERWSTSARSG